MDTTLNRCPKPVPQAKHQPRAAVPAPRMNCSRGNSDQYRRSHRAPNLKTSDVSDTDGSAMDTKKMSGVSRSIIGLIVIAFSFSKVCHATFSCLKSRSFSSGDRTRSPPLVRLCVYSDSLCTHWPSFFMFCRASWNLAFSFSRVCLQGPPLFPPAD
jgi:hypothetical protein